MSLVKGKERNFSPSYYSSKCVTTGLLIFLLKDALEYSGILTDKKNSPYLIYLTSRHKNDQQNDILDKIKSFEKKISFW